jgi:hypothetical protein
MTITITAFEASPDRGRGLARDMGVRWALEEVGQAYEVRLVSFGAMKEPAHLALHPFGQMTALTPRPPRRRDGRALKGCRRPIRQGKTWPEATISGGAILH